jgi:FHA domain
MASEGASVDVSVLEELIELRKQQELVDQFCARAEEMKAKVDATVYERVVSDYTGRKRALEDQAAPLVKRALAEYRKLRSICSGVQRTHHAAQLDKDEIEFRHSLGEIDEATRKERLVNPERVLAECAAELATLDAQDARFREALPNVDVSVPVAEEGEPGEPGEPVEPVPTEAEVDEGAPIEDRAGPGDGTAVAQPPPVPSVETEVSMLDTDLSASGELSFVDVPPATDVSEDEHTLVSPDAVLLSEADNGQAVNFALAASTYIGRAEDNQLRILDPGISRRHVLITATPAGYTIRDLKSQNGTYVNGQRINETALADGDRITIGEMHLIFRHHGADLRRHAS